MTLVQRFDRLTTRFDIVTSPTAPEPGRGTAIWTPEGYLLVDAYTCRSGLLPYSDGRETWLEHRPAEELVAALPTFARLPVTDDHPKSMVSSETWADVARGTGGDTPRIVVDGGTTYIRDSLLITVEDLLDKLRRPDGPRCVSIGFLSDVQDAPGTFAGRRYRYLQTGLIGNHDAIVLEGRAGDVCRIYMDSAAWTVGQEETDEMPASTQNKPAPKKNGRTDNLGTPVESVKMIGPDGTEVEVPTWVANELQALEAMRAKEQAPAAAAAPAPGAPAPALPAPAADVAPPAPAAPAAAPAPGAPPVDPDKKKDAEGEEEDKEKSMDAMRKEFTRRSRTERRALRVGFDDAHIDRVVDTDQLARDVVGKRMPWAAEGAKTARGDALDLLVDTAMNMPEDVSKAVPEEVPADPQPFGKWNFVERKDAADTDPAAELEAKFLEGQGY